MLILGIDPGYRSLGLALVDTEKCQVIDSRTVDCGRNHLTQHKVLATELDHFLDGFEVPACIAMERVPYGFGGGSSGGRTACGMWFVAGGLAMWAARRDIALRDITPTALKNFAVATIGKRYEDWPQKGTHKTRSEKK